MAYLGISPIADSVALTGNPTAPTASPGDNDTSIATTAFVTAAVTAGASAFPPGIILPYGGTSEPSGWLFCYGQAISRATYSALFTAIGTTFGSGDGSTTFNLPDCRGRVVAGKDDMGGSSANRLTNQSGGLNGDTLGATGGSETHALITAEMPAHSHNGYLAYNAGGTFAVGGGTEGFFYLNQVNATTNAGGNAVHNNVQPTIILTYIVKT